MKILLTRDSVAMGDDMFAPHSHIIEHPESATTEDIVNAIKDSSYLPSIHGEKATWSVVSSNPIAVIAQQWLNAKFMPQFNHSLDSLMRTTDGFKIHINYHAQIEPDIVYEVLRRIKSPSK